MRSSEQGALDVPRAASTRRHIISKLNKAAAAAAHLVRVASNHTSGLSQKAFLHARAYRASLCGAIAFEKRHWQDSLRSYSEASFVYSHLSKGIEHDLEDGKQTILSTYIDANLRYSAYQIGIPRSTPVDQIVRSHVQQDSDFLPHVLESHASTDSPHHEALSLDRSLPAQPPESIVWRSRSVKIEDAATAQALAQVRLAADGLRAFLVSEPTIPPSRRAAAYDDILIAAQDTLDAVKIAIDELAAEGVTQNDARMQALQITRTSVHYDLISWRIGRDRTLCGDLDGIATLSLYHWRVPSSNKAQPPREQISRLTKCIKEQVVLYGSILQSLESLESLPGVASDAALSEEIRGKWAYFESLRCLAVAQSHFVLGSIKTSLALLVKVESLVPPTTAHAFTAPSIATKEPLSMEVTTTSVNGVQDLVKGLIRECQGLAEVAATRNCQHVSKQGVITTLCHDLGGLPEGTAYLQSPLTWPPRAQLIPLKPILLDVAYNYIQYPEADSEFVEHDLQSPKTSSTEPNVSKRGWFGFGR